MKPILALLIATVLIAGAVAQAQEDMQVVDNDAFVDPQRPPAAFVHDAHNTAAAIEACNACHHVYENGRLVEDASSEDLRCSDCHDERPDGTIPGLMDAFHRNCKECHRQRGQGPLMCGECHRR